MKKILFIFVVSMSWTGYAGDFPMFSAFTIGKYLLVTISGDSCNSFEPSLEVPTECQKDRDTTDRVDSCELKLSVVATLIACDIQKPVPVSFVFDLNEAGVARELKQFRLNWIGSIDVKIDTENRD